MTPYTAQDTFPVVDIYELSDPVIGDTAGESNVPVKELADRTQFLYNRLGRMQVRIVTGNASVTPDDLFKLIKVNASGNITISLAPVADFPAGMVIPFKIKCVANKAVSIVPAAGTIEDGNKTWATLWACDGEEFKLVAVDTNDDDVADLWLVIDMKGNFDIAGMDDLKRIQPRNTIIANGCTPETSGSLLLRADFPRLWAAVSAGAINDALWLSDIRFKGFFSLGNETTTFRVPDFRGMSLKALDLGRGLSFSRYDNSVGGYERDYVGAHTHPYRDRYWAESPGASPGAINKEAIPANYNNKIGSKSTDFDNTEWMFYDSFTGDPTVTNNENTIKNIGDYPVIYY